MASLDDILTVQKNGVVGINAIASALQRAQGTITTDNISTPTVVSAIRGYLVNVCVVVPGSATGSIHNTNNLASANLTNELFSTPTTIGMHQLGQVFSIGLVIVPGTGQVLNVTYTPG